MASCPNLHNFILSPGTACPKLKTLNLSKCEGLRSTLIQSDSLEQIKLADCHELTKVRPLFCNALPNQSCYVCSQLQELLL